VQRVQIGLVGSGNMARAMARGWGRPVLCTAARPERAQALADEVGGEAVASNAELARRADLVVLCHKPAQLAAVAAEVAPHARRVASVLGGTSLAELRAAYPGIPVHRFMPNTPVAVRAGVIAHAEGPDDDPAVLDLFRELGSVITVRDDQIDAAAGLMGCAPAYWALVVEAQVDAGVRAGIPAERAAEMVVQTMAGSAALLAAGGPDTLAMRRAVTSPGGSTARGLAALERGGVRAAFSDAMDAVLAR
jgi:pyrroline-5-carboxylate reductase